MHKAKRRRRTTPHDLVLPGDRGFDLRKEVCGDRRLLAHSMMFLLIQALLGGSLFYNAPDNSIGLFLKGGALFFSILYKVCQ
jgi:hypothetical protein